MPAPRSPIDLDDLAAQELYSSPSQEALEIDDAGEPANEVGPDGSKSRDKTAKKNRKHGDGSRRPTSHSKGLPPGWVRVKSKSKPGAYYYAHPATNRTQVELPMDIYAGLEPVADTSEAPASGSSAKSLGPSNPTPADKLKAVAEEAAKKREDVELQRKIHQERALRQKRERDSTLEKLQAQEQAEEAAQEEELRRVRAKRKSLEAAKAAELENTEKKSNADERESEDVPRARASELRTEKGRGRGKTAGLWFGQSAPEPSGPSPEDAAEAAPEPKLSKKQIKKNKKKEAEAKMQAKDLKKLKKKQKKERKVKKQIKKAEKKARKAAKMIKKVKSGRCSSASSSSSSSSSSSES